MSNNANDDFEDLHKDLPADEREYMQRCHKPHGVCFHCGQAANQHHPVGPITITVSDPDGDESTHEFCNWATGPLSVPVACPSLSGTERAAAPRARAGTSWGADWWAAAVAAFAKSWRRE